MEFDGIAFPDCVAELSIVKYFHVVSAAAGLSYTVLYCNILQFKFKPSSFIGRSPLLFLGPIFMFYDLFVALWIF